MSKNRQFALPKSLFSHSTLKLDKSKEKEKEEEAPPPTINRSSSSPESSKPLTKKRKRITIDLESENDSNSDIGSSSSSEEEVASSDENSGSSDDDAEQGSLNQVIIANRLSKLFLKLERKQARQAKLIELTRTANKGIRKTNRKIEHLVNYLAERKYERKASTPPTNKTHKKMSSSALKIKSEKNDDDHSLFLNHPETHKKSKRKS